MTDPDDVIQVNDLTRRFGSKVALDGVSLSVPRGAVFGLVGANGAGKTTLIRHLLGLLQAPPGTVRVFGRDPVADPVGVLSRIGFLSEDNDLPGWMTVAELMRYTEAFFPNWDRDFADKLRRDFELDPRAKVKHLSRGQRTRAGLVVALAYRPELLVLDEPSSGLDPIVRRDVLGAVIKTVAQEGRTVVFSSHLLDEVERVSDHVALLVRGRVAYCGPLDDLKAGHHRVTVRFNEDRPKPPALTGALSWEGGGPEWTALCHGRLPDLRAAAEAVGGCVVDQHMPSLDEIFVARAGAAGGSQR
jgi:ABC-2 type transport system ATP-binding protein